MSLEDFQLLDNEPLHNSILERDLLKVYRQQGSYSNDQDQKAENIFTENNNYHQFGNLYLEIDTTVRREDKNRY